MTINAISDVSELLKAARVRVADGMFSVVSVPYPVWQRLLEDPDKSPRMSAPFMIFNDGFEITLVLDEIDLAAMRPALSDCPIESNYRLVSFDIVLEHSVVGFMAELSGILSRSGVPILPVSAYSRDHLLIRQEHLPAAFKALSPYVADIC